MNRLSQAVGRATSSWERRTGRRVNVPFQIRVLGGLGNFLFRPATHRWRGKQWTRSWTGWLLRAMRAADPSRVVKLESRFTLQADWRDTQARLAGTEQRMVTVLAELGLAGLATSITGLSAVGAASVLAETGDPARFTTGPK